MGRRGEILQAAGFGAGPGPKLSEGRAFRLAGGLEANGRMDLT
jgi:hypothetical protein